MDYQELNYQQQSLPREQQLEAAQAFPVLMRKVYSWMAFALFISLLYAKPVVMWVLIAVELLLVFGLSAAINRLSLTVATLMFVIYSVINGAMLSSVFLIYQVGSVAKVFFITAGTFAAMSVFGYTTKSDLTSWGKILLMALIGLIIASVVNIFLKSSGLDLIVSYAGVLIFVGLVAYDTQKIKRMFLTATDAGETMQKFALMGALSLYLDFINLFIHLLRILGDRRG